MEHFREELEGACEYAKFAEEQPENAQAFWAMGRDEISHANFFKHQIENHGFELTDDLEGKWHRVLKKYGYEK